MPRVKRFLKSHVGLGWRSGHGVYLTGPGPNPGAEMSEIVRMLKG